ncbi:MAG TPA: hypothetical protein VMT37_07215 [Solirubrobacterales bacterium]|nr:hypothetical protein [Solirubrobacterales bacterium]
MPEEPPVTQPEPMPAMTPDMLFKQELDKRVFAANATRAIELSEYTLSIFKTTLDNAAKTYKRITWMNYLMFLVGLGLFITAAVYGVLAEDEKAYAFLFAGLGAATFVALFLTGPIEKTQTALSNLVQAEVGFMNYFEQITLWETYALRPQVDSPLPDSRNIETASASLQQRTSETLELFQKYLEPSSGT